MLHLDSMLSYFFTFLGVPTIEINELLGLLGHQSFNISRRFDNVEIFSPL
jgi:hypothetical protein